MKSALWIEAIFKIIFRTIVLLGISTLTYGLNGQPMPTATLFVAPIIAFGATFAQLYKAIEESTSFDN